MKLNFSKLNVLIVSDSDEWKVAIVTNLREIGFSRSLIAKANNSKEAVIEATNNKPDIIFCSFSANDATLLLLKRFKEDEEFRDIIFIFLEFANYSFIEKQVDELLEIGLDGFILGAFNSHQYKKPIAEILEKRGKEVEEDG